MVEFLGELDTQVLWAENIQLLKFKFNGTMNLVERDFRLKIPEKVAFKYYIIKFSLIRLPPSNLAKFSFLNSAFMIFCRIFKNDLEVYTVS